MLRPLNALASLCFCGISRSVHRFQGEKYIQWACLMTASLGDDLASKKLETFPPRRWLVVGDGDLSYSSSIADNFAKSNTQLFATVLEDEETHNRVYRRSKKNSMLISSHPMHQVRFGIDGTQLETVFRDTCFDVIQFNFPHWRGKTNAKWNRELIDSFLRSASTVLHPKGEIQIALCEGQGGMPATSLQEWRQSWMPAMYAAEYELLLTKLSEYSPDYGLSSHRGMDRPFWIGNSPQMYTFQFPNGNSIPELNQISCRHELRVMLHPDNLARSSKSFDEIVHGDAVLEEGIYHVPDGIRFEVRSRALLVPDVDNNHHVPLAIFLLNYSGERVPLTRQRADSIRERIEESIVTKWGLKVAKGSRLVSRPYPYSLLPSLIKEYNKT